MNPPRGEDPSRGGARRPGSVGVLADRMAAALVHHEPGWRLPRLTALARRYSVSAAEVDAAIDELAARHLVRRLPDGQVYRASPAAYLVPLEGVFGLASRVDPMGGPLVCKSRAWSRRPPPEEVRRTLRLAAGEQAVVIRCLWTVGGEPGALSASYLPERLASTLSDLGVPPEGAPRPAGAEEPGGGPAAFQEWDTTPPGGGEPLTSWAAAASHWAAPPGHVPAGRQPEPDVSPLLAPPAVPGYDPPPDTDDAVPAENILFPWLPPETWRVRATALQFELNLPQPSAARSLRIPASKLVATVTVSFADRVTAEPAGVTMAMLIPELFRVVLDTAVDDGCEAAAPEALGTTWTHAMQGWEP